MHQPAAEGNSVGLVVELLRIQFIEVIQFVFLQNLSVQVCHTVYAETIVNVHICHMYQVSLVNNGYGSVVKPVFYNGIQFTDNGHQLRYCPVQVVHGPFFQRLCQNGMVGVCTGFRHNINGVIHTDATFHQQTD